MIKIMTLASGSGPIRTAGNLDAPSAALDIVCCQSLHRSWDSGELLFPLAQSLGLTCSCFAAHRQSPTTATAASLCLSGLAIFTGRSVWVLNSGSFSLPPYDNDARGLVQFAVVRKQAESVLLLNFLLAETAPAQQRQLASLFANPLLKEQFGVVALCTDIPIKCSGKKLQAICSSSSYLPQYSCAGSTLCKNQGGLLLLTAKSLAKASLTIREPSSSGRSAVMPPHFSTGLTIEFEMQRSQPDAKARRPKLPLSFNEQWIGGKEKQWAFAA